jgi:hypothetical protein
MPPPTSHDHQMFLKGTQPISVKPYRYQYFKTTKIEKNCLGPFRVEGYQAQSKPLLFTRVTSEE